MVLKPVQRSGVRRQGSRPLRYVYLAIARSAHRLIKASCNHLMDGDPDSVKGAPMADEVVRVEWLTNEMRPRPEQRRFASRRLAAQFVMEGLDEISRPTARMRVGSAELGLAGMSEFIEPNNPVVR